MNKEGCVFYFFNESIEKTKKQKQKIHKIVKIDFFLENELTNQKKMLRFVAALSSGIQGGRYNWVTINGSGLTPIPCLNDHSSRIFLNMHTLPYYAY